MTTTKERTVTTVEKLATAEELEAITDPRERLRAAAEVARRAGELAEPHRTRRAEAALQLYAQLGGDGNYGAAAEVWRDTLEISRSLWTRILEGRDKGRFTAGSFADPREIAAQESKLVAEYDALAAKAKVIRNATARYLMNGTGMTNAEAARISGMTPARMAQLRTSY